MWWISVYFILARAVVDDGRGTAYNEEEATKQEKLQCQSVAKIFWRGNIRIDIMSRDGPFVDELKVLHPAVRPFLSPLEMSRMCLSIAYRFVEQDMKTREFAPPPALYSTLRGSMSAIADHLQKQDITVRPLVNEWNQFIP